MLIGYPLDDPFDLRAVDHALALALETQGLQNISVIGPVRPEKTPLEAVIRKDNFFGLPLPAPPRPKLVSLLRRAARELSLVHGRSLEKDHLALVDYYLKKRDFKAGTRQIFANLAGYIEASKTSLVISARHADGRLAAFGVGEYASKHTAMFMFCFRDPEKAPPGSADLALSGLIEEAQKRGHIRMNLGLGINDGIRFFKRKWGAKPFLPCIEVSWEVAKPRLLSHLHDFFLR